MGNLAYLDRLLEDFIKDGPPGVGLKVFHGSTPVYERYLGYADLENRIPFNSGTILQLASMTKCIAVAAVMQLYEQGEFLLTDPVSKFIPSYKDQKVFKVDGRGNIAAVPAKSEVTVGHMFDMTSGLTVSWDWENLNSKAITKACRKLEEEGKYTLQEFAKAVGEIPAAFNPGEHFFYGQSHDILAAILEVITGMTFGQYLMKYFFKPLNMPDTHFFVPEEKTNRIAVLYNLMGGKRTPGQLPSFFFTKTFESACGGLYGTLEDYSHFAIAMTTGEYNGVRLLNENTIRLMAMNRLNPQAMNDFENAYLAGYGYGLGLRTRMNPAAGSNTSIGEFGWTGGFGTYVVMDPASQITIVYGHNSMPNREEYIHPRIRNIVYSGL
jgi:CubicO group peptidase (beta-lactamase class C family)